MAVTDQHEWCRREQERRHCRLVAQHIVPDRIARTRVEQLSLLGRRTRREPVEVRARVLIEHRLGPAGRGRRVGVEQRDVDAAQAGEIMVSDEADVRALPDDRAAFIRLRAVADEVAQAPDGVR